MKIRCRVCRGRRGIKTRLTVCSVVLMGRLGTAPALRYATVTGTLAAAFFGGRPALISLCGSSDFYFSPRSFSFSRIAFSGGS